MNVKSARVVSKADGDKLKLASEVERIPSVKIAFLKILPMDVDVLAYDGGVETFSAVYLFSCFLFIWS